MAVTRLLKRCKSILDYSVGDILIFLATQSRWVCVLALGLVGWMDLSSTEVNFKSLWNSVLSNPVWASLTVGATLLVAVDPAGRVWRMRRRAALMDDKSNYSMISLQQLRSMVSTRSREPDYSVHFAAAYEPLMRAAEAELVAALGLPSSSAIKINLLLLESNEIICVCARSRPGSPVPVRYPINENFPAAVAMKKNCTVVENDAKQLLAGMNRPYSSIAATPLVDRLRAYGAITADSPHKGVFKGSEETIDRVLRVYAGIILLTIKDGCPAWECPNRYGN